MYYYKRKRGTCKWISRPPFSEFHVQFNEFSTLSNLFCALFIYFSLSENQEQFPGVLLRHTLHLFLAHALDDRDLTNNIRKI